MHEKVIYCSYIQAVPLFENTVMVQWYNDMVRPALQFSLPSFFFSSSIVENIQLHQVDHRIQHHCEAPANGILSLQLSQMVPFVAEIHAKILRNGFPLEHWQIFHLLFQRLLWLHHYGYCFLYDFRYCPFLG